MATSCIIIDHTDESRQALFFKQVDFDPMINAWDKDDSLLLELAKEIDFFEGRTSWGSLDPLHWQFIVASNIRAVTDLPKKEQEDPTNELVLSLHMMIMGFILCMEERCSYASIEGLKITRLAELDCTFDFNVSMANVRVVEEKPKPTFSVIVDNTDKKA
jgi:hypothetical protein